MRNLCFTQILVASLVWIGAASAEVVFSENFEQEPAGNYSTAQLAAAWNRPSWSSGPAEGRVVVVEGAAAYLGGKSLRVDYPVQTVGPDASGAQWKLNLGKSYDTLYASYKIMVPAGFAGVKGGKLPGLCGGQCNTGGNQPTGLDGFSARLMWRKGSAGADQLHNYITSYLYYMDQESIYGDDYFWATGLTPSWNFAQSQGHIALEPGQWHTVTTKIALNTPGVADGTIAAWFDGVPVLKQGNMRFRAAGADFALDQFYFSTFFGGSDATWATTQAESIYFDDFIISTSPTPDVVATANPPGGTVALGALGESLVIRPAPLQSHLQWQGSEVQWRGSSPIEIEVWGIAGNLVGQYRLEPGARLKIAPQSRVLLRILNTP